MPPADIIPSSGEIFLGKYRIERVLGRGGMGVVLGAFHIHLDERVAIKFLLPELADNAALVTRFLREGRASSKIRSEHVARVLDVGTLAAGTPYLVMEHLDGCDLEQLLQKEGRLPIEMACDYLLQAIEALAEAHALGMVHRDLKPSNLFVVRRADETACVKLLDFGITKQPTIPGEEFDLTKTNTVLGSPHYMSPEQMRSSHAVDARSDIWALGILLYEILSGAPPFDAETLPDLLVKVMQADPVPLRQVREDAPAALERVIARCLERDVNARYADVGQLARELMAFGSRSGQASAERATRVLLARGGRAREKTLAMARRSKNTLLLFGACAALLGTSLTAIALTARKSQGAAAAPPATTLAVLPRSSGIQPEPVPTPEASSRAAAEAAAAEPRTAHPRTPVAQARGSRSAPSLSPSGSLLKGRQ